MWLVYTNLHDLEWQLVHMPSIKGVKSLICIKNMGKISAQRHTTVKQIYFPSGSVLFLSLFSLSKNWMHNVVWGCEEILPDFAQKPTDFDQHESL